MLDIALRFARAHLETLLARRRRGPRLPSWSFSFEAVVTFLQRDWEHLGRLPPPKLRAELARRPLPRAMIRKVEQIAVHAGGVPAKWFVPPGAPVRGPVLFYLHGGSYVFGSTATHADLLARFALETGARTLAIDYRLAPEHPYPAALEDALAAYRWLVGAEGEAPSGSTPVVVAGESAGGNLVLATLLALRDAGEAAPAGGILVSPWLDLGATSPSTRTNDANDYGTRAMVLEQAKLFAGEVPLDDPRVSPLFADVHELPPLLVQVGGAERLHDEAVLFARRARDAGVEVTLDVLPEMPHAAALLAHYCEEGRRSITRAAAFFRTRTASGR